MPPPAILGHEGTGIVQSVGHRGVPGQEGDKVIGSFIPALACAGTGRNHQSNLCEQTYIVMGSPWPRHGLTARHHGMTGLGTFADEMTATRSR